MAFRIASPTFLPSNPRVKPSANEAPMLVPSSTAPLASIPSMASNPAESAVPIPSPILPALSASQALPVEFHHSLNGCAMILSQAIFSFSPKFLASFHSWELTIRCMLFLNPSTLAITHLEIFAPAFFQASPHSAMISWFSSIQVVILSSPGFIPSHKPCPHGLKSEFSRVSLRVDIIPLAVLDWLSIMPPKRLSMPRNNASIIFAASMLSLPMFAICSPVRPSSSCRIWLAGTPSSWSCKSSSVCARPLACI